MSETRGGALETSAREKVDTGMFSCAVSALHYSTCKSVAASARDENGARTGCHSDNDDSYVNKMELHD